MPDDRWNERTGGALRRSQTTHQLNPNDPNSKEPDAPCCAATEATPRAALRSLSAAGSAGRVFFIRASFGETAVPRRLAGVPHAPRDVQSCGQFQTSYVSRRQLLDA